MAEMKVTTIEMVDGEVVQTESTFTIPPDLEERMEAAHAEYKRLEEAGTPYWCVHEGRSVTHPAAYWQQDGEHDGIHHKHGVMCRDCGGYIQEG